MSVNSVEKTFMKIILLSLNINVEPIDSLAILLMNCAIYQLNLTFLKN